MRALKSLAKAIAPASLLSRYLRWRKQAQLSPLAIRIVAADEAGLPPDPAAEAAINAMLGWLGDAQDHSTTADGGFARHFNPTSGWAASYPETTGYIIPTLLDEARIQGRADLRDRARRALSWLCDIQFAEGGFQGGLVTELPSVPVTFNTGQILLGLVAGARAFGDERYVRAAQRAADWLRDSQDADGCWRRHPSPFTALGEKAYETHVSWGLLEADRLLAGRGYGAAAHRQIAWALTKREPNGWFRDCCLTEPEAPLTHTIGYVLRGVIEGYRQSPQDHRELLDAAAGTGTALLACARADGTIPGRLDRNWQPTVTWTCLTGCAQIAACWLLLFEATNERKFLEAAKRTNAFVRRTVAFDAETGVRGGVKGSHPFDGGYGRYEFLNWAAKFAIDACRLELRW
jgi:hypothetical protein